MKATQPSGSCPALTPGPLPGLLGMLPGDLAEERVARRVQKFSRVTLGSGVGELRALYRAVEWFWGAAGVRQRRASLC